MGTHKPLDDRFAECKIYIDEHIRNLLSWDVYFIGWMSQKDGYVFLLIRWYIIDSMYMLWIYCKFSSSEVYSVNK